MNAIETRQRPPGFVKSSILRWLGVPISLTDQAFWNAFLGGDNDSGEPVTVNRALQLSAVWSCVRLISETIATLPLGFYERLPDGSRKPATDHQLSTVLREQPNGLMTSVSFWEVLLAAILLRGNGNAEIVRRSGQIVALNFLQPERLTVRRERGSPVPVWTYIDPDGTRRRIPPEDMFHVPGFSLDGVLGLSVVSYATQVFGTAIATDKASAKVFAKGLRASGFVISPTWLKKEQRTTLRASLKEFSGQGAEAGGAMVLEGGTDYKSVSMNPEDAQMLQSRAFNVEEICRWFRVPPFLVGHSEKSTSWGSGIEQQMIGFITFTLRPWLARVEKAISRSLIAPADRRRYFAEFAIEGLLRGDSSSRSAFYSTMTQNGIYTRDDCREKENLQRRGGQADVLTVQSNLVPIDQLGAVGDGESAKTALRAWLGLNENEVSRETQE